MIKSMTGFGRAAVSSKLGKLTLEITSVNKRFLEVNMSLPKNLSFFEHQIRKWVEGKIFRGQINLRFDYIPNEKNIDCFLPDVEVLKLLKKGWEKLSKDLGYKNERISLEFLLQNSKYFTADTIKDEEVFKNLLFETINNALDNLIKMKSKEGQTLLRDIEKRINLINKEVFFIKKTAPKTKENFAKKMKAKFDELLKEKQSYEDRLLKEIAIYAEKIDITEEIIRLQMHLKQFMELLKSQEQAVGRKLEFLLQECLRETNTLSAKACDAQISKSVVEIKSEIEKIKEQIQNIE